MDINKSDITIIGMFVGWLVTIVRQVFQSRQNTKDIANLKQQLHDELYTSDNERRYMSNKEHVVAQGLCQQTVNAQLASINSRIESYDSKIEKLIGEVSQLTITVATKLANDSDLLHYIKGLVNEIKSQK